MRTFLIALVIASLFSTQTGFCKTPDPLVFEDVTVVPMDKEQDLPHRDVHEVQNDPTSYAKRSSDWVLENRIMVPFLLKLGDSLREGGVHLMCGTDATNPVQIPGFSLHDELEQLVQSGFTPYEALVTTTGNPQLFLGHFKDVGTVTPGKVADLVLLDSNPLENITNARKIAGVAVRGKWFDRDQLDQIKRDLVAHFAVE